MNAWLVFGHVIGAVVWSGGVIFLGVVAASSRRTIPEWERIELFHVLGRTFLWAAASAALLLAFTGNMLVDRTLGGWGALAGENRDLIIAKTALFAFVLAVAAVHGLVLGPRIRELRLRALDGAASEADECALKRRRLLSSVSQVLMLVGTFAILALAANLVA